MPPNYKLTYFNVRRRGECARLLFAYAGVPYKDNRISKEVEWPKLKPTTPWGQIPLLEVDGVVISQSNAICRYLARQFGLAGKTPLEEAHVDSIADAHYDYMAVTKPWFQLLAGHTQGDKDKEYKETVVPAKEKLLPTLENFLQKSGSGYLVGNSSESVPDMLKGHPEIVKWIERVRSLPAIKKWIEERPKTKF